MKQYLTNISLTLIGMQKHYEFPTKDKKKRKKPRVSCIRCISQILADFSMNLAPVSIFFPFASVTCCQAFSRVFVYILTKAGLRVHLNDEGDGNEHCLS